MKITLWGVRGSIPTTGPDTKEYGGNTSCVEVESDGWLIILDAGSGIQKIPVNEHLNSQRIDILLTHLHMDHIQGLGFFSPLFDPEKEVHIWGPVSTTQNLRSRLSRFFSPPLFPVYFRNLTCKLFIHEIDNSTFDIGPFTIQSQYIIHPGPTIGFRVQDRKGVFTYLPDHEPALGKKELIRDAMWLSGGELASGADLLLHDAQYTTEEYAQKVGWGHSSMEHALEFAALTKVRHLLLTHHDPMHSDAKLHELYDELVQKHSFPFTYELAVEGSIFEV